jgi:hypothetical protein
MALLETLRARFAQLDAQLQAAPRPAPDEEFDRLVARWLDPARDLIATPARDADEVVAKLVTLARVMHETGHVSDRDLDMLVDIQRDMQRLARADHCVQ